MDTMVHVWAPPDLALQHLTVAPADDTVREWEGTTACGLNAVLRWVHGETVDRGAVCEACIEVAGPNPPLQGDDPGPV